VTDTRSTRRRFLQGSGVTATIGLAGCSGLLGGTESDPQPAENESTEESESTDESDPVFATDFEDTEVGQRPTQWDASDAWDEFETLAVVSGGADGSEKALHLESDDYGQGGTEDKYGAYLESAEIGSQVSSVSWYWKKQNKWDSAEGYGEETANGPSVRLRSTEGQMFSIMLGTWQGFDEKHPLSVTVSDPDSDSAHFNPDTITAGEFSYFEVSPDFERNEFALSGDGSELGVYDFKEDIEQVDRMAFKVGGWGVNAASEIDEVEIRR